MPPRPLKTNVLRNLTPSFTVITNPDMITTVIDIDLAIALGEFILNSQTQPDDVRIVALARKLVRLASDSSE